MNIEKIVLTGAKLAVGAGVYGFKGVKFACSTGHTVANGLRKTADVVDAVSTFGENKCQEGIEWCEATKAIYKARILEIVGKEAAELKSKGININNDIISGLVAEAIETVKKETKQAVETIPKNSPNSMKIVEGSSF